MKIDTEKIPGFDTLPEEAKTAILEMEFADAPDMSQFVAKSVFDRKASEAAEANRKLKSQMTQEEQDAAKRAEELSAMKEEIATLRAEKAINEYTAQFLGIGYDKDLAKSTATALHNGDMNTLFANHAKHVAEREKVLKAELLRDTPKPPAGNGSSANNWQRKIEEAQAAGDAVAVAYYMRMAALEAPR
jgi:hypothetical protein